MVAAGDDGIAVLMVMVLLIKFSVCASVRACVCSATGSIYARRRKLGATDIQVS